MREVIFHSIGFFKLLCEEVPLFCIRFQIEGVSQEIVGCCIFVHATDKIRDGVQEMFVFHYRSI